MLSRSVSRAVISAPADTRLIGIVLRWAVGLALLFPLDARGADDDSEIPDAEEVSLTTKDGLLLHATFFPGTHEKESVPIILLHGFKSTRHEFDNLALLLQSQGHAVIAPDLRGHGESVSYARPGSKKLEANALRRPDFDAMIQFDLETVKAFLIEKNNEGELNIDKLCVVGSEMGGILGAKWAALDWSWPLLATGKQGQDVKGLVLISPEPNFKGMQISDATSDPNVRSQLAILLIAGKKSKSREELNRLYANFEKFHITEEQRKDLEKFLPDTKLQGGKLLGENSLGVNQKIGQFVARLVRKPFPWAERKNPLGKG